MLHLRFRAVAGQNARVSAKQVILLKDNIVQQGLEVLPSSPVVLIQQFAAIALHLGGIGSQRRRNRDGDTLDRADVSLAPDLHGTIFDHDVGPDKRIGRLQVRLQRQAKDRSIQRIDSDLAVIAGKSLESTVPVISTNTAELHPVMRLLSGNRIMKDRLRTGRGLLPMAPDELAM